MEMSATSLILLMVLAAAPVTNHVKAQDWILYRNWAAGLSFRHPPSLRVRERDPLKFGLPDAELIVDLIGDTKANPGTTVLRFIVNRGEATPQTISQRSKLLRATSKSLSSMPLDGHQALVSVFCGRAACHWSVEVLQPRECTILTLLNDPIEDQAAPPHDGTFPLLSIIETLHFESPKK